MSPRLSQNSSPNHFPKLPSRSLLPPSPPPPGPSLAVFSLLWTCPVISACPDFSRSSKAKRIDFSPKSMKDRKVWSLVPLPQGRKAISSRWVFKTKLNSDNTVERLRARLVAKGYSQRPYLDYNETFAPVARATSLRVCIAIAVAQGWQTAHLDVTTAFLYGDLEEDVYMACPRIRANMTLRST